VMLVFGGPTRAGRPDPRGEESLLRFRLGLLSLGLVVAILVIAPTVVFGLIFGPAAVIAHWAAVVLLATMTLAGLYLIFTDKSRRRTGS
jgi:hypothetical protein